MHDQIKKIVKEAVENLGEDINVVIERPSDARHGDYTSNVALVLAKKLAKNPRELAESLTERIKQSAKDLGIEEITVAGAGFINFHMSTDYLFGELHKILENDDFVPTDRLKDKKFMVEYAHPNTHKEMHIGHMRTLITGEAIARLLAANGATVFRANYQGDIGPHVAKAIWGIEQLMKERRLSLAELSDWLNGDKAHFLGEGYARGSTEYEANKDAIDAINTELYAHVVNGGPVKESRTWDMYIVTRQWSLDYYQEFYERFYTKFDRLFFESAMVASGKKIVEDAIGSVFTKENGAIIFPGEKYGLHTRVFITQAGNPTYEGKEMGNGFAEQEAFPFDMKVHVVASEQAGYFQVVFKALELIAPDKFKGKQHHVSMGMVTLTDRKMSSRTGDVLTVDWLLDQVKEKVNELFSGDRVDEGIKALIAEEVTIAAVKHSVLRVGTTQNVAFSIDKSVTVEGDSGPYLQYTYVRTQSVLEKADSDGVEKSLENVKLEAEELSLLRRLAMFDEVIERAALLYNPSIVTSYLFDLAQDFNLFYQKVPILKAEGSSRDFRLALTDAVGRRMRQGLDLLGIKAPEKM
jgi:arginyl-tRNA synthetase